MRNILVASLIAFAPSLAMAASDGGPDVPMENAPKVSVKMLVGSPRDAGLYIFKSTLPPGGFVPPHSHTDTKYIAVLSGTLYVCNDANVHVDNTMAHHQGEFFVEPKEVVHCSWARDGGVEYLEIGVGPSGTKQATPQSAPEPAS